MEKEIKFNEKEALYLNGMYDETLQGIICMQKFIPDYIGLLQPYKGVAIKDLKENPPLPETPMWLYMSLGNDLGHVHYIGEIVGWMDKPSISGTLKEFLDTIARAQGEPYGLYEEAKEGTEAKNLIFVRNVRRVKSPIPVSKFIKLSDGTPLKKRESSGGWSYVEPLSEEELKKFL